MLTHAYCVAYTGFDSNYPATAPTLALKDGKGLGDEREKQLQVQGGAAVSADVPAALG